VFVLGYRVHTVSYQQVQHACILLNDITVSWLSVI